MFSVGDLMRISSHGVDLSRHGPHLLSSFCAYKLSRPKVLWINRQWLAEVLGTKANAIDWSCISSWLIDEFGYAVPLPGDSQSDFMSDRKEFFADRYGDDALTPHGGSGRVGTFGSFQIKGIGPTPLVGRHADWLHNHGCLWLEEGIREAVVGELIRTLFPVGSVPVLALIDTGIDARFTLDSPDRRRTILVRPSFFRPAHMQRAPMFIPLVGDRVTEQFIDARRTRDMVATFGTSAHLREFVEASARQVGYAYFHRCFLGGMLSSNWTLDGRVADFGGITNVPNWDAVQVVPGLPHFGSEAKEIEVALESICNRIGAASGGHGSSDIGMLVSQFRRGVAESVEEHSARFGLRRHGFRIGDDGTLHSAIDPGLRTQFQFNRNAVQSTIWHHTADDSCVAECSVGELISDLLRRLTA
jgi:hypothetical protein